MSLALQRQLLLNTPEALATYWHLRCHEAAKQALKQPYLPPAEPWARYVEDGEAPVLSNYGEHYQAPPPFPVDQYGYRLGYYGTRDEACKEDGCRICPRVRIAASAIAARVRLDRLTRQGQECAL